MSGRFLNSSWDYFKCQKYIETLRRKAADKLLTDKTNSPHLTDD